MEGATKIPEDNTKKPKNSIVNRVKKWAKIGAIASVGLIPSAEVGNKEKDNEAHKNISLEPRVTGSFDKTIDSDEFIEVMNALNQNSSENIKIIENLKKEISEIKSKNNLSAEDKGLIEERTSKLDLISKALEVYKIENVRTNIRNAYKEYDQQHEWVNKVVSSPEYKKRFKEELLAEKALEKLDPEMVTNDLVGLRKKFLNNKDYNLVYNSSVSDEATAQYNNKTVDLPVFPDEDRKTVGVHEFTHDMTDGGNFITEKASDLYIKSLDIDGMEKYLGDQFGPDKVIYYADPTERDARKKVLEYDLEKLGVKKYGEEFTEDHYKKSLELMKEGKLSNDSEEFIRMTKSEYFLQIMNEIAENPVSDTDLEQKA